MTNNENNESKSLDERVIEWKEKGKSEGEITYGMLCDGFQSIEGMSDDFYSQEDPADRGKLWNGSEGREYREWKYGEYRIARSEDDDP